MTSTRFEELAVGAQFYALADDEQILYTKTEEYHGSRVENAQCESHSTYFKPTELVVPVGILGDY